MKIINEITSTKVKLEMCHSNHVPDFINSFSRSMANYRYIILIAFMISCSRPTAKAAICKLNHLLTQQSINQKFFNDLSSKVYR